jgi:hypothetical protein
MKMHWGERRIWGVAAMKMLGMLVLGAVMTSLSCGTSLGAADAASWWQVKPQSLTRDEIAQAQVLPEERLDVPTEAAYAEGPVFVPNAQGTGYVLLCVFFNYGIMFDDSMGVAVDTLTGEVTQYTIPKGLNLHLALERGVFGRNGEWYCAFMGSGPDQLWRYDPAKNLLASVGSPPVGTGSLYTTLATADDGKVFGTTDSKGQVGVFHFDPATAKFHFYGWVGPQHVLGGETHGYCLTVVGEWVYVASGKVPWWFVPLKEKPGKSEVILDAPAGNANIWLGRGQAWRRPLANDPGKVECYELTDGKAVLREADWKPAARPGKALPPKPEIWSNALKPTPDGRSELWWRLPGATEWTKAELNVKTYPQSIARLSVLPDGRLFGTPGHYEGNFVYDPKTGESEWLGRLHLSHYATAVSAGKVYMSGYPNSPIYEYDPSRAWTAGKAEFGKKALDPKDAASNPRLLLQHTESRVHKMWEAAVGSDGSIYFCGEVARQGNGGGFGWWNPKDRKAGCVPADLFDGYKTLNLVAAEGGSKIVLTSHVTLSNVTGKTPETARAFVFDVAQAKVVADLEPVRGATVLGPVLEVAPGKVLGVAQDSANPGLGILYGLDLQANTVSFRKSMPLPFFCFSSGMRGGQEFLLGPDGYVWTYLGHQEPGDTVTTIPKALTVLVRIHPQTAEVAVVGRVDRRGPMAFVGKDLYRGCEHKSGPLKLRRLAGIVRP